MPSRTRSVLAGGSNGSPAAFVPFINCGFPEAEQTRTAVRIARQFASAADYDFAGALPLGGGGVLTPDRALHLDEEVDTGTFRSVRGGSWAFDALYLATGSRSNNFPDARFTDIGFRCARDP